MTTGETSLNDYEAATKELYALISPCRLCPRECRVDRTRGELGFCGTGRSALVSSAGPHFGEERPLVGTGGSGTIFFAGCNLGCIFCQNYDISHLRRGHEASPDEIAKIMLYLQNTGCLNINFVTPTHVVPQIVEALAIARSQGLSVPTVYNCGGYDSVHTLKLLDGIIQIYMPDMKYADPGPSQRLSAAPDYFEVAKAAIREMHRQVGDLEIVDGVAKRGLLVRHLVLPNDLAGTTKVVDFLADEVSPRTYVNIMDQYRPCFQAAGHPEIARYPTPAELRRSRDYAERKGLRLAD